MDSSSKMSDELAQAVTPFHFSLELTRPSPNKDWTSIPQFSSDWSRFIDLYEDPLVVRIKCLLQGSGSEHIVNFEKMIRFSNLAKNAINAVIKAGQFSVSPKAPLRCCFTMLLVFPSPTMFNRDQFSECLASLGSWNNDAPYVTYEMLDSFLTRRAHIKSDVGPIEAIQFLKQSVLALRPVSSLFLKLSASHSEEALRILLSLTDSDPDMIGYMLGDRSVHRLIASLPSCSLETAVSTFKLVCQSSDWGYVAYNTLIRMAINSGDTQSIFDMYRFMLESNLDQLDKLSLQMMYDHLYNEKDEVLNKVMSVTAKSSDDYYDEEGASFILELLSPGSAAACHLASTILRKCSDNGRYKLGWQIASSTEAMSKQVFSETVHLCSFGYFQETVPRGRTLWFERVRWCIDRHLQFLNRYPCGLALHLASHARRFDICWRWFTDMNEQLAFRLTGYHTSAVLKSASYASDFGKHMPKICQAYSMTPTAEKSTFTFIPLTRIWNLSSGPSRLANLEFWDDVARDIKLLIQTMTDGSRDATSAKMIQKLRQWVVVQGRWKASVSETTPATSSAVVPATQDLTTLNDNMILRTSLFPVRQSAASPASIAPRPWATRSKLPPVASSEFVMEQNMSSIISSTNKLLMAPSILDSTDEIVTAPNSDWKRTPISFKGRPQAPSVSLGLGHMLSTSSIWGGASPDNTRSW